VKQGNTELSKVLQHVQFLVLASGLIVGGGIFLLAPWLALNIFHQVQLANILRGFAVAVVLAIELRVVSAATRISQRMQFSVLSEDIIPVVVNLSLVIVLVFGLKMSTQGAVISVGVGFVSGWVLALFFLNRLFRPTSQLGAISVPLSKELMSFSLPTYFAGIFSLLLQGSTILLIGYFLSPSDVGIYQVAAQVSILSSVILTGFTAIFVPMIPGLHQAGQMSQLNELFKVGTKWGLYISLPLLVIVVLLPRQVLGIVYGQGYVSGLWPLVILTFAQLINTGTGAVGYLLMMTHHQNRLLILSGVSFLISLLLGLWLIPLWGIIGGAVASACGLSVFFLVALYQVRSLLGLWPYDRRYRKGLFATILTIFSILALKWIWPAHTVITLVIQTLISMGIFYGALLVQGIEEEDKSFVQTFVKIYYKITRNSQ
jgi:O-antigen/teichoic acid export membrane protein